MNRPSLAAIAAAALLVSASVAHAQSNDPLEPFNRAMYGFNKGVVDHVINPTVDTVSPYVPPPMATALGNAYNNLTEVEYILNGLLRADPTMVSTSVGRFAINSTVGIGGLFDVASEVGLARQTGDFGEAMCAAGVAPGPYVVLPLAGPANATSAGLLAGGIAVEVYLLSFISTALAAADFLVIDLGGSAAALRYATDIPPGADGYSVQRAEYNSYINSACVSTAPAKAIATAAH